MSNYLWSNSIYSYTTRSGHSNTATFSTGTFGYSIIVYKQKHRRTSDVRMPKRNTKKVGGCPKNDVIFHPNEVRMVRETATSLQNSTDRTVLYAIPVGQPYTVRANHRFFWRAERAVSRHRSLTPLRTSPRSSILYVEWSTVRNVHTCR